jgi:molybdate transport system substrate-binding protein
MAAANSSSGILFFSLPDFKQIATVLVPFPAAHSMTLSPDGKLLALGTGARTPCIIRTDTFKIWVPYEGHSGAPVDVFLSADTDWIGYLDKRDLLRPGTRTDLLRNRLVLIAPADASVSLSIGPDFALATALGAGRLAMANPDSVPAGKYGKAALNALGVWTSVESRIARTENVRAVLMLVARGEAPLGIVYATDAMAEPRVRTIGTFPEHTHPPIVYPIAIVASSRSPSAQRFVAKLSSPAARAIWVRHGFGMAN